MNDILTRDILVICAVAFAAVLGLAWLLWRATNG